MFYRGVVTHEGRRTLIEFPDAPGCYTFAEPRENIRQMAQEALEGWLEASLAHGEAPPVPSLDSAPAWKGKEVVYVPVPVPLGVRLTLRWARLGLGLSQADLAKLVGVSRQQISALESPDANLRLATLEKVATAMGMQVHIDLKSINEV